MTPPRETTIAELLGKTLTSVTCVASSDELVFVTTADEHYRMYHDQDCCESVTLDDIAGELSDLVGSPVLLAEVVSNEDTPPPRHIDDDSWTWTFYKLATAKGYVTLRWYGTSNGYYSESVDFVLEAS